MPVIENAVGYCRVSTAEQNRNSHALENQRARVLEAIGPGAVLYEDICSGSKSSRPGFDRMLTALRSGRHSNVVITRPDRLGRNQRTGFQQIVDWWVGKGGPKIKTVALDVPIDLDQLGGRFNLALLSEAAIFEVDMLSSRIRAGHQRRMLEGVRAQRPPFGYVNCNGVLAPDWEKRHCPIGLKPEKEGVVYQGISDAELYKLLLKTYLSSASFKAAIATLQPYALTYVPGQPAYMYDTDTHTYRCMRSAFPPSWPKFNASLYNVAYRGHRGHRRNYDPSLRPANGEQRNRFEVRGSDDTYDFLHENVHEALMTDEQWEKILLLEERKNRCKTIGAANRGHAGTTQISLRRYPLTGLLFCSCCERRLSCHLSSGGGYSKGHFVLYYRCKNESCSQHMMMIEQKAACLEVAMYLQQWARRVQANEEDPPELTANDNAELLHLQSVADYLEKCPDRRVVAAQLAETRRQIRVLEGQLDAKSDFLSGNGRQLLLSPKAADWSYWTSFIQSPDNMLYRLPLICGRIVMGYACEEDRPVARAPGAKGRRPRADRGKVSVMSVALR